MKAEKQLVLFPKKKKKKNSRRPIQDSFRGHHATLVMAEKAQPSSSVHVNKPTGDEKPKKEKKLSAKGRVHNNPKHDKKKKKPNHRPAAYIGGFRTGDVEEAGETPEMEAAEGAPTAVTMSDAPRSINDMSNLRDMQQVVEGMDYELSHNTADNDEAFQSAVNNLQDDPDFYRKKDAAEDRTDDVLQKADKGPDGIKLDLGSGNIREKGHIGVDLYPHDNGTFVHDLHMGLPFPDGCASKVRVVQSLQHMDELSNDPKPLLSEIERVLMPGGQFVYEGPNEIYNYPKSLVMTHYEDNDHEIDKSDESVDQNPIYRHEFTRVAYPDPATADDAEPRIGISQYDDLPADALLAIDALGYYNSDATSSGRGNRLHGYPSQGALVKSASVKKSVPIMKMDKMKQVVYGVVLAPDEVDSQEDWMHAEDIEKSAHAYMENSRVIGKTHESHLEQACPVESYIAPQDFQQDDGPYGPQLVKKGSWVMGVKIKDPQIWQKVLDGEYQGFSVGGLGLRT